MHVKMLIMYVVKPRMLCFYGCLNWIYASLTDAHTVVAVAYAVMNVSTPMAVCPNILPNVDDRNFSFDM